MAALVSTLEPRLGRTTIRNWKLIAAACAVALLLALGGAAAAVKNIWFPSPSLTPTPTPTPVQATPSPERVPTQTGGTSSGTPTTVFQFEPVGKWTVSTGGATAGSMTLLLKQDQNYEISNPQGTFQQLATVIGSSGTWTFNRADMSLTLLGTGSRYGLAFRITGKQNNTFLATGVDGISYTFTPVP